MPLCSRPVYGSSVYRIGRPVAQQLVPALVVVDFKAGTRRLSCISNSIVCFPADLLVFDAAPQVLAEQPIDARDGSIIGHLRWGLYPTGCHKCVREYPLCQLESTRKSHMSVIPLANFVSSMRSAGYASRIDYTMASLRSRFQRVGIHKECRCFSFVRIRSQEPSLVHPQPNTSQPFDRSEYEGL